MQPVKKKRNRPLKISQIVMILSGFLAVLLVLYFLQRRPVPPPPITPDISVTLIDRSEESLVELEVNNSKGETFTLIRSDKGFTVSGQPEFEADENEIALMVKDFSLLVANELAGEVHTDEASLAQLGLGKDAPRAKATYQDGSSLTLVFGDSAQTEIPSDYLMVEGENQVYFVSPETREHFDRALSSIHIIPSINFNEALVDSIEVNGEEDFVLSHREGLWELASPYRYPLDAAKVHQLLTGIGKMRFAQYYGSEDELDLKALGLNPPGRKLDIRLSKSTIVGYDKDGIPVDSTEVPAQTFSLALGDNIGQIGLYCLYEGKVYQATNVSMGFLRDMNILNLLSKSPVTLPLNRIEKLAVTKDGETREYDIDFVEKILPNNEVEQDKDGNVLYEPFITLKDEDVASDEFIREYLKLMALKHSGRLPEGYQPGSEHPTISYTFIWGEDSRELALFPFDDLHYAMRVNGVFVDYILKSEADAVSL